jgi:hypothetical protein
MQGKMIEERGRRWVNRDFSSSHPFIQRLSQGPAREDVDVHHPRNKGHQKPVTKNEKKSDQTRPTPDDMQNESKAIYSFKQ